MSNLDLVPMNFKDNCKWVASGFAFEAQANPIKISSTTFTCKLDRFEADEKIFAVMKQSSLQTLFIQLVVNMQ